MWLQHQYKRQLRLEKADSKRNVTLIVSWQNPIDWLRHAGAKPREEVDYSAARQDTSSDRDCRFDQKEESSMIGRDLFNIPCRICRRPTIHRTRTRHPERKSKSEGHCGSYRAGRERRNSQIPTSTQALLPTSTHSNGFCIIWVCIRPSSSSEVQVPSQPRPIPPYRNRHYRRYHPVPPTRGLGFLVLGPSPLFVTAPCKIPNCAACFLFLFFYFL